MLEKYVKMHKITKVPLSLGFWVLHFKPFRNFHINVGIQLTIQICYHRIHMMHFQSFMDNQTNKETRGNCIHHTWIRLIIINLESLREYLSYESGFIPHDLIFLISFPNKDPLVTNELYSVKVRVIGPKASRLARELNSA